MSTNPAGSMNRNDALTLVLAHERAVEAFEIHIAHCFDWTPAQFAVDTELAELDQAREAAREALIAALTRS